MIGFIAAGAGIGVGLSGLGAVLASEYMAGNIARDVKVHEYMYGTNCARGNLVHCSIDRDVINADASDAKMLRTLGIGLGIGGVVVGAGGLVLAIIAKPEPSKPEPAKPADEAPAAKKARLTPGLHSLGCGPFGDVGVSCVGTF